MSPDPSSLTRERDRKSAPERRPRRMSPCHRVINVSTLVAVIFVLTWAVVGVGGNAVAGIGGAISSRLSRSAAATSPPAERHGDAVSAGGLAAAAPSPAEPAPQVAPGAGGAGSGTAPAPAPGQPTRSAPPVGGGSNPPGPPPAPVIDVGPAAAVQLGALYAATGSVVDNTPGAVTGTVNFGDGSGDQPLTMHDRTFTASHVYGALGTFTVIFQVIDARGAVGTGYTVVTVNPTVGNRLR